MERIQFIHPPRTNPATSTFAIAASCAFHALTLGSLLGLACYYQSQAPPSPSGSAAGAPTITLEAMVVAPTRPEPPPASVAAFTPPTIPMLSPPTVDKTPQTPIAPTKIPDDGVPVLPLRLSKSAPGKTEEPHHTISHATTPSSAKPVAATKPSSYAPGINFLPHPPYPTEAQNRGLMGTVYVDVHFDAKGRVTSVDVTESSGVKVLDSETQSFIRTKWHCPSYAGQIIKVPVKYHLE